MNIAKTSTYLFSIITHNYGNFYKLTQKSSGKEIFHSLPLRNHLFLSITRLHTSSTTAMLITHNMSLVDKFTSKVYYI